MFLVEIMIYAFSLKNAEKNKKLIEPYSFPV